MPSLQLSPQVIKTLKCPAGRKKIDFFDTLFKGLFVEVRASGGMTYYQHYRDPRGVLRQIKLGSVENISVADARKASARVMRQVELGEDPLSKKSELRAVPTFAQFIKDQYLPHVRSYKKSWETDVSLLKNHLLPRFGNRYMDEISRQDIVMMHADRRASGAAPGSANRLLIMMRYCFNLALRWELPGIKGNPTKNVPLMAEDNKKERYLSEGEARRLYEAVCESENTMLQYIVPMLILTGARKREVLDAKWEDFDFDRRLWRIPTTKLGKPRHVPLSDGVLNLLSTMPRNLKSDHVFANPKTNKPFVSIFCAWNTARKKAGLADVRVHDLRHSFASLLINSGRSLYEVQKLLGHTQIKTTQRYAHLAPETLLAASNAATKAVGSIMGVMPNRVVEVPLVAVQG
jgi:integrase